ncbi:RNA ligase/cyclic nucleotide phosphodiesterase [Myxozyma melibiosi]|uniref:RNA ligase/cyclic nucleotide phosphodiesterase n=1 Tax=Myxozyma melibiosi TaxID=54550 RepID=A0ABR1F3W0_9ASCO
MPVNGPADVLRSDASPEPPSKYVNTFGAFLELYNSPADLIKAYEDHRQRRNLERRSLILSSGIICPDKILRGLVLENQPPEFDPRNCISLWCRPPSHVMQFIAQVQSKLRQAEPEIWCMPQNCLHMTALEIVHSKPDSYVNSVVAQLQPHLDHLLAPLPAPLLVKPILSYDQNALAISFVPEEHSSSQSDWYTYQHYRRDLCDIVQRKAGITVDSRYHFPSAHVTIARFVKPLSGPVEKWIDALDAINEWIASSETTKNIRWVVGEERGSECRCGLIWYGGGRAEGIGMTVQEATHRERKGRKERHVWRVR